MMFRTLIGLIFSFSGMLLAKANTFVIPSPMKTARVAHQTGAATAWSKRKRFNFNVQLQNTDEDLNGSPDEEIEEIEFSPYIFQTLPGGGAFEAGFIREEIDTEDIGSSSNSELETNTFEGRIGLPIVGTSSALGFEVQISKGDEEDSSFGNSETEDTDIEISYGLQFNENYYAMVALELSDFDDNGVSDEDEIFYAGIGQIVGDLSWEVSLGYQNEEGTKSYQISPYIFLDQWNDQHILFFSYGRIQSASSYKSYYGVYSYHHDMGVIYIKPMFSYQYEDSRFGYANTPGVGVELGQVSAGSEPYIRLNYTSRTSETGSKLETDSFSINAGLTMDI